MEYISCIDNMSLIWLHDMSFFFGEPLFQICFWSKIRQKVSLISVKYSFMYGWNKVGAKYFGELTGRGGF